MMTYMKDLKYKIVVVLLLVFTITSCEDFLGGDINADPNKPGDVPVSAQLPNVQIVLADITGGDWSRFNCMLMQQVEGVARQWSSFNQYNGLQPSDFDAAWQNIYENALVELNIMGASTREDGNNHYLGVVNVLKAYTLMMATDVWGDIPYTEAALGAENISPNYDDQATVIYPEIFALLNEAITLFGGAAGPVVPGSEDVYYGGTISNWIKAATALRARANLHQGNYAAALTDAQSSFESAADNLSFQYDASNAAQWFRFNRDRTGDLQFHPFMKGLMEDLNDTRVDQFSPTFEQHADHPYLIDAYEQELISYREIKFIEAECLLRTSGSAADLREAYLAAIQASFEEVGLGNEEYSTYVQQDAIDPGEGNITENNIMIQKYIGLFAQPEVFSDWRRTDIPILTPVSGSVVPVRWNYSADEFLFNENAPPESEVTLFTPKVDWDN